MMNYARNSVGSMRHPPPPNDDQVPMKEPPKSGPPDKSGPPPKQGPPMDTSPQPVLTQPAPFKPNFPVDSADSVSVPAFMYERDPDILKAQLDLLSTPHSVEFSEQAYALVKNVQQQCAADYVTKCASNVGVEMTFDSFLVSISSSMVSRRRMLEEIQHAARAVPHFIPSAIRSQVINPINIALASYSSSPLLSLERVKAKAKAAPAVATTTSATTAARPFTLRDGLTFGKFSHGGDHHNRHDHHDHGAVAPGGFPESSSSSSSDSLSQSHSQSQSDSSSSGRSAGASSAIGGSDSQSNSQSDSRDWESESQEWTAPATVITQPTHELLPYPPPLAALTAADATAHRFLRSASDSNSGSNSNSEHDHHHHDKQHHHGGAPPAPNGEAEVGPPPAGDFVFHGSLGYGLTGDSCMYQQFESLSQPCQQSVQALHGARAAYWDQDQPCHHGHAAIFFLLGLFVFIFCRKLRRKKEVGKFLNALHSNPSLKAQVEAAGIQVPEPCCAHSKKGKYCCFLLRGLVFLVLTLVSAFFIAVFSVIATANILQAMASTDADGNTELPSPPAALSILFLVVAANVMMFTLLVKALRSATTRRRAAVANSNSTASGGVSGQRPGMPTFVSQWVSRFRSGRADRMGAYAPLSNESQHGHGFVASTGTEMVFVTSPPIPATAPAYAPEQGQGQVMGYCPPSVAPVYHGQAAYTPVSAMPVSSVNMF